MTRRLSNTLAASAAALLATASLLVGQDKPRIGFKDTPMLPGGKWHVHDGDRPQPPVVTPGTPSTQEAPGRPPSDAIVLFDGKDVSHWRSGNGPAAWKVEAGALVTGAGKGELATVDKFGDIQLHVEWSAPTPPRGRDQGRGNSGIIFFGKYEVQVLDCFENQTYPDGQTAAIYGQYPPLVNACLPPGQWQTYDILFTAPRFKPDGSLESPAYATVLHNGVLVHNHTAWIGPMTYRGIRKYEAHEPTGPIVLQDHGNPVRYRNIWVRPIKGYDAP